MKFELSDVPLIINGGSCVLIITAGTLTEKIILCVICGATIIWYGHLKSKGK